VIATRTPDVPPQAGGASASASRLVAFATFMLPIGALLLLWEGTVRLGLADATILPAPSMIVARAWELLNPVGSQHSLLLMHIGVSLWRAPAAFVLACLVAIPLGFALGLSKGAYRALSPLLSLLLPLPAVAWTPIFLVAFGQGDITIIGVCFLGAFFPVLYSTIQGVRGIGVHAIWVVRSMGAGPMDLFRRVLLPGALPALISGLKLGMAHSWRTLVAAEMLAALSYGLGYMIFAARSYMDVSTMFVGIVCLAVIGLLIEHAIFGTLERMTVARWHSSGKVRGAR